MDGRDLASINASLPALIKRCRVGGDKRPVNVLVAEILLGAGFADVDVGLGVGLLRRRAAVARRSTKASAATGTRLPASDFT